MGIFLPSVRINGKQIDSINPKYEAMNFLEKRKAFLTALLGICQYNLSWVQFPSYKGMEKVFHRATPEFRLYNLQTELPEGEHFDGYNFKAEWNTRDILLSEGVLELEKGTPEENIKAFWDTCLSLMNHKIHFAVFYAEGMRTPHIHIYDLFANCEDWAEKNMAMALFCRKVVPFEWFHLLDRSLWEPHTIALEFSKHYRYGTMNKLLFEYTPEGLSPWFAQSISERGLNSNGGK